MATSVFFQSYFQLIVGTLIQSAVYILRKGEIQMSFLQPFLMTGLAISLILTSCSPVAPATLPASPFSTSSPEPILPQATFTSTPETVGIGLPAFQFLNDKSQLVVISSVTGQELNSFTPIPIHDFYSYAFAPDAHILALAANSKLYLIDLPTWKTNEYNLGLYGWMSSIVYSADGLQLAIASGGPQSKIWIVDPSSGKITANQRADFSIRKMQFTTDGKSLMAYGPHIASTGVAANAGVSVGAPKAAIYAISDLALLWSTELNGIRDGTFPKKPDATITDSIYQPGSAWHYEPGTAFSPKSDVLYLVHGDEDKLTTVDFANQKVHTLNIQAKTSWLDRIMALTAGVAYAKGMDGTVKQAFISSDGKFLFVGGNIEKVTMPTKTSSLEITDSPIGLQVISLEDGALVKKIDDAAVPTGLSSDGQYLFLTNWDTYDGSTGPKTNIFDTTSMSIVKQLNDVSVTPTRRLDGTPILVSTEFIGTNGDNTCNLATVDPVAWNMTNRWQRDCVIWLTTP